MKERKEPVEIKSPRFPFVAKMSTTFFVLDMNHARRNYDFATR